jgi:hypothetical protein
MKIFFSVVFCFFIVSNVFLHLGMTIINLDDLFKTFSTLKTIQLPHNFIFNDKICSNVRNIFIKRRNIF